MKKLIMYALIMSANLHAQQAADLKELGTALAQLGMSIVASWKTDQRAQSAPQKAEEPNSPAQLRSKKLQSRLHNALKSLSAKLGIELPTHTAENALRTQEEDNPGELLQMTVAPLVAVSIPCLLALALSLGFLSMNQA